MEHQRAAGRGGPLRPATGDGIGPAVWSKSGKRAVRRASRRTILGFAMLLALACGGNGGMDARQSSPFADREASAPELCQIAPRSISFFQDMESTPRARSIATPVLPPQLPMTVGEPADAEAVAAITATIREVIACTNAGDQLRIDALYSDDYFLRQAAMSGPPSAQFVEFLASPATPLPVAQRAALYGVRDVQVLPDGRVRALIGFHFPPDDVAFLAVFVRKGERWLIDESAIVSFDTPITTTPEP